VSVWANLRARLRLLARAALLSEEHLGAIAQSAKLLEKLNEVDLVRAEHHLTIIAAIMARREMVQVMADPSLRDPLRLERSGFKVRSQYDEDGIIAEIFRRIGTRSRIFVEFGSGRGDENCTAFLLMQGWRGLWIEGDPALIRHIEKLWAREVANGLLTVRNSIVTVDSVDDVIASAGFGGEIDLLAVDIDGNDYHVLERISTVAPRVICVEYNASIPPEVAWVMPRDDDFVWRGFDDQVGASLKAFEMLLSGRGYVLVGCAMGGVNAFFVRADLVADKFAAPFTAENHYHPWRLFYSGAVQNTNWRGWRV
jgi:hypothetical protein